MEEIEERRRWLSRQRRPTAACLILIVIYLITMTPLALVVQQSFYVTRTNSIRIGPFDEEMSINFDYYNSETDLVIGEDCNSYGRRLDPSDSVQEFGDQIWLLWNQESVWIKVYFDQPSGTPPSFIQSVSIGQRVSFVLWDIEISLIIE